MSTMRKRTAWVTIVAVGLCSLSLLAAISAILSRGWKLRLLSLFVAPLGLLALKRLVLPSKGSRTARSVGKISPTVLPDSAMRADWSFIPSPANGAAKIQTGRPASKTSAFVHGSFIVPDAASA